MKIISFLLLGLTTMLAAPLFAGETLRLKLEPDRAVLLKGRPQEVVVKIDLAAVAHKTKSRRTSLNLAVVLDRSGSMTGTKIEKAKQAAMQLVDRLAPEDFFSLITYSDAAEVLIPSQRVDDKASLKRRIDRIQPGGSTALYAGVKAGAGEMAEYISSKRINRVMLLSDGLANIGPSSPRELRRLGHELSTKGIAVTTIGVGDDYNEDLMAGLAEASDANYYYVKDTEKLPQIFAKELGELLTIAAREVSIEIICPDGVKPIGFIGRHELFENQRATVKLSHFTLGQNRYVFLRCLVNEARPEIAQVNVRYADELENGIERTANDVVKIRFTEDASVARGSINTAVTAEKELVLSAVAKDEALVDADAGNFKKAGATLARQADALEAQYETAPAAVQIQIREETKNLRDRSQKLQAGQYDSSSRKMMQSESYNTRNFKNAQ
jgi:Ca-activated chloride channel homolog